MLSVVLLKEINKNAPGRKWRRQLNQTQVVATDVEIKLYF